MPVSTTHGYRYWVMVSRDDPMDFVFVPGPCLKVRETQSAIVYGLAAVAGLTGLALVARGVRRFRRRATAGA